MCAHVHVRACMCDITKMASWRPQGRWRTAVSWHIYWHRSSAFLCWRCLMCIGHTLQPLRQLIIDSRRLSFDLESSKISNFIYSFGPPPASTTRDNLTCPLWQFYWPWKLDLSSITASVLYYALNGQGDKGGVCVCVCVCVQDGTMEVMRCSLETTFSGRFPQKWHIASWGVELYAFRALCLSTPPGFSCAGSQTGSSSRSLVAMATGLLSAPQRPSL